MRRVRHSDAVSLLISRFQTNHEFAGDVCDVCREDGDCRDGACVVVNGQGRCAQSCLMHGDCPEGFLCTSVRSLDRTQSNQCLPISGRCVSGCDSKRVQESRSEIDIGIDAELEMNLCSGRIKQVNVDVEPGEGVRVLIDHAESEAERSGVVIHWSRGAVLGAFGI